MKVFGLRVEENKINKKGNKKEIEFYFLFSDLEVDYFKIELKIE